MDRDTSRLLTHNGSVSPVIIPTRHMGEESNDPFLHTIFITGANFRGKDNGALQPYLQDSLSKQYDEILLHPDNNYIIPEDFVDIIATAISESAAANTNIIVLKNIDLLYLMEFSRIYKVGGVSSPYAGMEWPGIQIPQAISAMITEIGLRFTFADDIGSYEESVLYFYDRNPSGSGLDFAENPEQEEDFMRYAVELHCLKPVHGIAQTPLPQLEEIARGTAILLVPATKTSTQQRKYLDAALKASVTATDWFTNPNVNCQKNLELNYHLGAERVMSLGRIHDPEGANHLVNSY